MASEGIPFPIVATVCKGLLKWSGWLAIVPPTPSAEPLVMMQQHQPSLGLIAQRTVANGIHLGNLTQRPCSYTTI